MRLAQALRWRLVPPEEVSEVFAAAPGAGGPARACRRAMGVLRLGADPLRWELPDWPGIPQGAWHPQSQPLAATLRLLRALWQGGAVRAVAARRLEFAQLRTGVDWLASLRATRKAGWGPARLGALRSVMTGDVVTEQRAAHWGGRGTLCPECGEVEGLRRRFWECRAWAQTRAAAAAAHGWTPEGLVEALPEVTLLTGLVPLPEAAPVALVVGIAPPAPVPPPGPAPAPAGAAPERVWTDGGGAHPEDPLLACAVWSVFWGPGDPRNGADQVTGAQTAQRGELEAVTRAAEQRRGLLDVGTDSQYVVDGTDKLGRGRDLSDELHGDLWARLKAAGGGTEVTAHKVPAHQPRPDPPRLSVADWAGNAAADAAATAALQASECLA